MADTTDRQPPTLAALLSAAAGAHAEAVRDGEPAEPLSVERTAVLLALALMSSRRAARHMLGGGSLDLDRTIGAALARHGAVAVVESLEAMAERLVDAVGLELAEPPPKNVVALWRPTDHAEAMRLGWMEWSEAEYEAVLAGAEREVEEAGRLAVVTDASTAQLRAACEQIGTDPDTQPGRAAAIGWMAIQEPPHQ